MSYILIRDYYVRSWVLVLWWDIRNGIQQRKTSWQDGVLGTNCPIPPNSNWTYKFQAKDQIGTYNYFPSTKLHRAAGGFGGFNIAQRSVISIPYPQPDGEFTLLVADWYKTNFKVCMWYIASVSSIFCHTKKIFYISSLESYKYMVKTLYYFIQNGYSTVLLGEGT